MTTRADIVTAARQWVGTRWRHQGAQRGVGVDCVGLLVGVALELGIADARQGARPIEFDGYGRAPNPALLLKAAEMYLDPEDGLTLGGVLLMRFHAAPQHFAIVSQLDPLPYIVHAYAQARKVVENRLDDLWRGRVVRHYQFRGVSDG